MLDTDTKRRIDTCRDILVGKVPDPKSQVEQITIALIYKFMNDMDLEAEELGGERRFFTKDFERYRWAKLVAPGVSGQDMLNTYSEALQKMVENEGLPKLFRDIFRNAYLPYRDPETLRAFLREIDTFTYDHSERLGDAFEYLLSVLGSQGDAGQFRTPRHIIDFMVDIIAPQKTEVIMDPACGTAGFLISAYKHILKQNSTGGAGGNGTATEGDAAEQALESPMRYAGDLLAPEDRARLARNIRGYDISPDMVRLSLVNLYLHGFADPKVEEYDTLTSEDKWTEMADVILANPPFMSPKGGIKPHTRFQVQSKRSEVLFVDYIAEHLTPNGRAAIVVPEGVIFQSQSAYVALRKMLVENHLAAVISLPAGVFNPYSGVKTSILILDRAVAKASGHVAFFKIENDGFALGAQRKAVKGSQLAQVKAELGAWLQAARAGGGEGLESSLGIAVERERLADGGDYNLSGERYSSASEVFRAYPMVPLGEVATLLNGRAYKQEELLDEGPVPVLRVGNFFSNRGWYYSDLELPPEKYCLPGDLLFAWSASFGPKIWDGPKAIYHYHIWKVVPGDQIDKHFLFWVLRAEAESIKAEGSGIAMIHATKSGMEKRVIPLPPLEVQREIVAEVEGYQRVIDGARAVLDNYRPHIPVDPDWPMVELKEVAKLINGDRGKNYPSSEHRTDQGIPFVNAGHLVNGDISFEKMDYITQERFDLLGSGKFVRGDILYCLRGSLGKCAVVQSTNFGAIASSLVIIRPNEKALAGFIYNLLIGPTGEALIEKYNTGSAQPNLSAGNVGGVAIPLPPIEVQETIVAEIEAEQALVGGNRDLIARFEKKIDAAIARVWGEAKAEGEA